ncbi:VOC family protein [Streptomyces clavuligerus]|uniref:Glyoxalase/bleomycin resistance protein/dioxygenase n=1 Tax=Streptomyces clavuligerus TaxID=1901 RepID=E2Q9J0_STRCL|nr:VOC family protein [Streptomyces clavuligerus]ANW21272.1 glyoxalase [Streptomyces clavuligerus]AXU15898.1 VOC family protein [Streptomyces clavuligerus]EFG05610.1 glyoxalase/bleomycin resistance protein/dioxygenase [Streptomyces clavuligerus]MBY6306024.1 VOC family protein [Streptomyces clavuligerus]QCS08679.1 VOC family protein [Streptomyces clavuligerus]
MRARLNEIVLDCHDPARLVRFWAALLGGEPVDRGPDWSYVDPPDGGVRVAFQRVPEGKSGKNRLHLDLDAEGGEVERASDGAVALGATRVGPVVSDPQGRFQVLRDPEGNEFCFVAGG